MALRQAPLRIAINARMTTGGKSGGVEFVVKDLIRALAELDSPTETYDLVINPSDYADFAALAGANMRLIKAPLRWTTPVRLVRSALRRTLEAVDPTGRIVDQIRDIMTERVDFGARVNDPGERRFLDGLGCQVIHFPYQTFIAGSTPSVYNPHDLQHRHFPSFFHANAIKTREAVYATGCRQAHAVAVSSSWVKQDIVRHYGLDPAKIHVIPWGIDGSRRHQADKLAENDLSIMKSYGLHSPYCLYPAATWEHKNHLRLLEALKHLRDEHDIRLNLVCTGNKTPFWPKIKHKVSQLGLDAQVRFTGIVPRPHLEAFYRKCICVVIPSLFEASSALMREAWLWEAPVASSTVTSLPDQAGDAALLFEPTDIEAIASALLKLCSDAGLRDELRRRGRARLARFPWSRTARAYRALYRLTAGRNLDAEDRDILYCDWMKEPL
jgi:glycosyltransferase involved in cell wall biosynthesis